MAVHSAKNVRVARGQFHWGKFFGASEARVAGECHRSIIPCHIVKTEGRLNLSETLKHSFLFDIPSIRFDKTFFA
jgi:hypothetical protein